MSTLLKKKPAKALARAKKKKPAAQKESQERFSIKRLLMGEEKPDLTELESGSTTILDILSPTAVDTKSRDYIVVDGVFHAYLYVTGYGYATTVGSCWLAPLVEAGEGVNLSFIFKRQPKDKILSKIAQTTMVNRSRMRDVEDTRSDFEELDSAISSGLYLKDVMNRQGEDFYYMHTLIEVVADDPETLEQRVTAVEKLCVSIDMIARRCDYKNEQAFLSALPLLALDQDVERKSRRNALTSGVAAAFPFASYELSDRNGIFLGLNLYNRSPVFLDPYDDYKYTNGNCWIGGSSGAGKTFTLQCLGGRLRQQGRRVIFIVPKKGHEFRPLCELLGGLYLRMSPSSRDCPNIMAIRRRSLDSYAGLRDMAARDDSVLADKISRLIIWYSLQKRDLSDEDKNYLDSSLVECYLRYGITFDNATITDETGAFVEMPIIADWHKVLAENPETKHLSVVLARYVTGSASAMGARNDIDLDNKYIVLDTSGMPDDLLLPGIFWATDIANDLIMDAQEDLSALIADELWSLVGANSNPLAAGFVQEMVKTIRGLGGIAVTSTQGMQDLFGLDGGKYGKGILDSSRIKLVMQMEEQEARLIQGVLNLSEDEVRQITRFRRGEGLLCIGYNHVPIQFHATAKEYDAITTSPTDLRARRKAAEE
ncbi:VirB4 family type IV secretion system protein [uncultured Oscillibacter sp.]|uniref:VirB4 family type IV secretion system protein n=1 Tax=uncultured Oscillibacter sp. TaxID=876091 RepID=UPI00262991BD|nr:hypothetical protein [uncultured Oscillibacter sp.]